MAMATEGVGRTAKARAATWRLHIRATEELKGED